MNVVPAEELRGVLNVGDDLLRVAARVSGGAADPVYYFRGEATDDYYCLDEREKIRLEVSRWRDALTAPFADKSRAPALERLSPALFNVFQTKRTEAKDLFARTIRMLHLLEALFLQGDASTRNPYKGVGCLAGAILDPLLERLRRATCNLTMRAERSDWTVSLPLLIIVAVAESQCEWFRLFTWEAYSAGRALHDFRERWKAVDFAEKVSVLNTLYCLIRCQSVVGQIVRGTSGRAPLDLTLAPRDFAFEPYLEDALRLLAIVEEARNRPVPRHNSEFSRCDSRGALDPDVGVEGHSRWNDDRFLDQAKRYVEWPLDTTGPTWSFFGPLLFGLDPANDGHHPDIDSFKATVQEVTEQTFSNNSGSIANISVGRAQIQNRLRPLLRQAVEGWAALASAERASRFKRFFRLQLLQVPSPFAAGIQYCVQVLLQDRIAAQMLLFPDKEASALLNQHREEHSEESAGELFRFLLEVSDQEMNLKEDSSWAESATASGWYMPVPLIHRITSIIHVLRPEASFQVPIQIDGLPTEWVYLPYGIRKDQPLYVRFLANLVLAIVMNRAMAQGMDFAEIDLENLVISETAPIAGGAQVDAGLMSAKDWRELIINLYKNGGYELLLGRYLRDFNTRRENVRFDTQFVPNAQERPNADRQEPLSIGSIKEKLGLYLRGTTKAARAGADVEDMSEHDAHTPELWLLGVDIGGTLTKCQMFRFRAHYRTGGEEAPFTPQGHVFKMATAPPVNSKAKKDTSRTLKESIKEDTRNYAQRLIKLVKDWAEPDSKNLDDDARSDFVAALASGRVVVGLSWPGPVRDNHVAGTSGILRYFGGLSRSIPDNRIDDIWEVDIASAVADVWREEFRKAPFVSLLNDGDADAVGAVVLSPPSVGAGDRSMRGGITLSVVKLGTGLAGALLSGSGANDLILEPGLFEWGKLILDAGAPLRKDFPQGVAAEYLSKRCLPRLAKSRGGGHYFRQDDPDSAEIGLIFETALPLLGGPRVPRVESYLRLRVESGATLASRISPWGGDPVSAEVLKAVYYEKNRDPDLLYAVQLAMRRSIDAEKTLKKDLEEYGLIRVGRLIGLHEKDFLQWNNPDSELAALYRLPRFEEAGRIARASIVSLGNYLGDFCVLLYDQLGINVVRLTGGVLSGDTGVAACKAAALRVQKYGLELLPSGHTQEFVIRAPGGAKPKERIAPVTGLEQGEEIERGALGAASFAAASLLHSKRQEGLQSMSSRMLRLAAGKEFTISGSVMLTGDGEEFDLGRYGLAHEDLLSFLRARGPAWGFYRSSDTKFLRWVVSR